MAQYIHTFGLVWSVSQSINQLKSINTSIRHLERLQPCLTGVPGEENRPRSCYCPEKCQDEQEIRPAGSEEEEEEESGTLNIKSTSSLQVRQAAPAD